MNEKHDTLVYSTHWNCHVETNIYLVIWFFGYLVGTYTQSGQVIVNLNDVLDGVSNSTDDSVNDMHNTIGCNLVAIDDPGTVHSHHLHRTLTLMLSPEKPSVQLRGNGYSHPIGIVVNMETKLVVHGGDRDAVL